MALEAAHLAKSGRADFPEPEVVLFGPSSSSTVAAVGRLGWPVALVLAAPLPGWPGEALAELAEDFLEMLGDATLSFSRVRQFASSTWREPALVRGEPDRGAALAGCAAGLLAAPGPCSISLLACASLGQPPAPGLVLSGLAMPKALAICCIAVSVGGGAMLYWQLAQARPKLAVTGAWEHDEDQRAVEQCRQDTIRDMTAHLEGFLAARPNARYEEWIADYHPENVLSPEPDARGVPVIDRRLYAEGSEHRMMWNNRVQDESRHVSQFSMWLSSESVAPALARELAQSGAAPEQLAASGGPALG